MDPVELWVFVKTRRELVSSILIGALLFGSGWQMGRVMSPYYATEAVTFTAAPGEGAVGPVSPEQLTALREAGIAQQTPVPSTKVAGASSTQENNAAVSAQEGSEQGVFVGSRNSNLYHHQTCSTASRIKPANQLWWNSPEEAEGAGYKPSKCSQQYLGL